MTTNEEMDAIVKASARQLSDEEIDRRARIAVYNTLYFEHNRLANEYHEHGSVHPETRDIMKRSAEIMMSLAAQTIQGPQTGETKEEVHPGLSHYQVAIETISEVMDRTRRELFDQFMKGRGTMATFESGFVLDFDSAVVHQTEFRRMDEARFTIEQKVAILTPERAEQLHNKAPEEYQTEVSLRARVQRLLDHKQAVLAAGNTGAAEHVDMQLAQLKDELTKYDLRITEEGNLESV